MLFTCFSQCIFVLPLCSYSMLFTSFSQCIFVLSFCYYSMLFTCFVLLGGSKRLVKVSVVTPPVWEIVAFLSS